MSDDESPRYLASEGASRYYDGDYDAIRTPSGDVDFYVGLAAQTGGPVLEVGCGTGRILIPTARQVHIDGVDPDATRIAILNGKLSSEPADVKARAHAYCADIFEWQPTQQYRLITMPFRVLQHFVTLSEQDLLLNRLRALLLDDGQLAFDVFAPNYARLAQGRVEEIDVDRLDADSGRRIIRRSTVDHLPAEQRLDVTCIWSEYNTNGRNTGGAVWRFPMRYYFRYELERMLAQAGFHVAALYGTFDRQPFDHISGETIVIARPA